MLLRAIVGVMLGGLAGLGMNRYVGCANGTCLITSSLWGSVAYWMVLGFVVSQIRWPAKLSRRRPASRNLGEENPQKYQGDDLR